MCDVKKIADYLLENNNYYIVVHKNPDGDCLGSAKAMCLALRQIGKNAKVVLPNAVSPRLEFMWDTGLEQGDFPCVTAVFVDVASLGQMGQLYDSVFKSAPRSICIDHHGTNSGFADLNLIDGTSAATGELIYDIIVEMNISLTEDIAKALLVSVADDTGSFQYSNTTAKTHAVASELYRIIPDSEPIMRALYGTHTINELEVLKLIIPSFEYHLNGKVCFVTADVAQIEKIGADRSNIDAWIGLPRSVEGVEVAAVFKIISPNEIKVSFRSNDYVDVSSLAKNLGGGGHIRASGTTLNDSIDIAKKKVLALLEKLV